MFSEYEQAFDSCSRRRRITLHTRSGVEKFHAVIFMTASDGTFQSVDSYTKWMIPTTSALPLERRIWIVRGQRVMLDADLAEIYGVPTKRLNEQVKRNRKRFPRDFIFRLTPSEANVLLRSRSQSATLKRGQNIKYLPFVFTEHGAVMLATVLSAPIAVAASLRVVRAFVRLRELLAEHDGVEQKVSDLERRVDGHSDDIGRIFNVLQKIVESPGPSTVKKIGFVP